MPQAVALRKESVDRNNIVNPEFQIICVALRKESVDRNKKYWQGGPAVKVALRKESVDRNLGLVTGLGGVVSSLSARRAWIEIIVARPVLYCSWSLSARRAWIEIGTGKAVCVLMQVALRKESVDRNA